MTGLTTHVLTDNGRYRARVGRQVDARIVGIVSAPVTRVAGTVRVQLVVAIWRLT